MYELALINAVMVLAFTAVVVYAIFKLLEYLINNIQEELSFVKWEAVKTEPFRAKNGNLLAFGHGASSLPLLDCAPSSPQTIALLEGTSPSPPSAPPSPFTRTARN